MRLRLRVRRPALPPEDREFLVNSVRVGRAPTSDVVIADDAGEIVSAQHLRIDARPDGVFLHDLKSTNGTYLNSRKVEWPERLHAGDQIQLGRSGPTLEVIVLDPHERQAEPTVNNAVAPRPLPPEQPGKLSRARAAVAKMRPRQKAWLAAATGGALLLLVGGAALAFVYLGPEPKPEPVEEDATVVYSRFADLETDAETVRRNVAEVEASTRLMYDWLDKLDAEVRGLKDRGAGKGEVIYQRALASTAWVLTDQGHGHGIVIEQGRRKRIVTAYHVVHGAREIKVLFPKFLDGKLLGAVGQYMNPDGVPPSARTDTLACTVWAGEPGIDLAVLDCAGIPSHVPALKIAPGPPEPGAEVHAIGNPAAGTRGPWSYTRGTVREVVNPLRFRSPSGHEVTARVVETQAPTIPEHDGGPLVNNRCEVVGIASGAVVGANLVPRLVEVGHLRGLLDSRPRKGSSPREPKAPATPPASGDGHVFVLLLTDDTDPKLKPWLTADQALMSNLIRRGLPAGRASVTTMNGTDATGERLREYYRTIAGHVTAADTVMCYYSGRGGMVGPTHFLSLGVGGPAHRRNDLSRHSVLTQMQATGARLAVLITNCFTDDPESSPPAVAEPSAETTAFLVPLLTQHRGVVNWQSSAPGQVGLPGVFTPAFCQACETGGHDSWSRLFADVKGKLKERPTRTLMTPHLYSPESAVRAN